MYCAFACIHYLESRSFISFIFHFFSPKTTLVIIILRYGPKGYLNEDDDDDEEDEEEEDDVIREQYNYDEADNEDYAKLTKEKSYASTGQLMAHAEGLRPWSISQRTFTASRRPKQSKSMANLATYND